MKGTVTHLGPSNGYLRSDDGEEYKFDYLELPNAEEGTRVYFTRMTGIDTGGENWACELEVVVDSSEGGEGCENSQSDLNKKAKSLNMVFDWLKAGINILFE